MIRGNARRAAWARRRTGRVTAVIAALCAITLFSSCNKSKASPPATTTLRFSIGIGSVKYDLARYACISSFEGKVQNYHLDRIDAWLDADPQGSTTATVTLYIQEGLSSSSKVLATSSMPAPTKLTPVEFAPRDGSGNAIEIPVGQTFYIRIGTNTSGPVWVLNDSGTRAYLDGTAWLDGTSLTDPQSNNPHEEFSYDLYSIESF